MYCRLCYTTCLIILALLPYFFIFFVQLTIQCNNSYHSEKRIAMKFIILFLVLLLQFKVMLSSDKYKKSLCTFFYKNPRFLRLTRGFGQKDKKHAKKFELQNLKTETIIATQRKLKVSH